MALSVKRFIHALDCPEPSNQVNVNYHATSAEQLCDGNGTLSAIFAEAANLGGIIEGAEEAFAGEGGLCADGMDVVFVVDYTGSMSGAISGVKTGLSSLVSTIDTASGGNYRLGLVLFDGSGLTSPNYSGSGYYQALPASQKINVANSNGPSGGNIFITCVEKMNTVGNSTSFGNALNAIDQPNSSTGMSLGSGTECGGQATYEVVANDFAGAFRSGVQKLIILVTDDNPENTTTWFQNTLTPALNNAGAQVMINSSQASDTLYSYIANNTQPAGATHYSLNFNGTWTTGLETSIDDLCESTFTYTCDGLAVGWYQEVGQHTAYYWDGSAWTSSHACEYTVTINLVDNSSTTNITAIPSNNAYYSDSDTYVITGTYGTTFDITNTVYAITDYTFSDITNVTLSSPGISVFTDNGAGGSGENALLSSNEFQITGTVTQDLTVNVTITGSASQSEYSFELNIIGDETDQVGYGSGDELDANSEAQSPGGYVYVSPAIPASGWVDVGSTYLRSARRYTFTGVVGSSHSFDVNLTPSPTDYDLTLDSVTKTTSNTAVDNGLNYTLSNANKDLTGTFTMPSGGGSAELFVLGQVNQPDYTYTLTATDAIIGASIDGAPYSQTFTGYTGDTFNFTIQLSADTDYSSFTIDETLTLSGNNTAAIDYTVDNVNGRVTGTVTMPADGGDGAIRVSGSATQTQHTYTITFVDPYTDTAAWQDIIYTGVTGSFHATTHPLSFQDGDTNYYVGTNGNNDGVTNDDSTNLTSNRNDSTDYTVTDLNIVLASMPQGGGSATVTVTGSQSAVQYTFTTSFSFDQSTPNCTFVSNNLTTLAVITTGTAGSTHTISGLFDTPTDYEFTATPTVSENSTSLSSPVCVIQPGTGDTAAQAAVTLTMPSGGGNGAVTITPSIREKQYSFTLTVETDGSTTSVNGYNESIATSAGNVTGTNNGDGTVTITYGPMYTGDTVNDVRVVTVANNSADYIPEITGFSWSAPLSSTYLTPTETEYGGEGVQIDFTMPSQDPRYISLSSTTLTCEMSLSAIQHSFTINFTDTIANVTPDATEQTLTGGVGDDIDWVQAYSPSSGYTMNITSVSDDSTAVSSQVVPGGQSVSGNLIMPSGGGSATVTASGTSTLIQYNFTITWTNNVGGADWLVNNADSYTQTLTMAPGTTANISQQIDPDSGREITSLSATDNSGNVTITSTSADSGIIQARVTMPSNATGNQSATITATGSTAVITRSLTVTYSESISNAYITNSSSSGAAIDTGTTHSGTPGATGTVTRYLMANTGYTNPVISSMSDNSAYITNLASASSTGGSGLYRSWTYDYQIPPSNASGTITIGGSVSSNCAECSFSVGSTAPTTYNGSNGIISVVYADGSCNEPLTWGVSPSAGPEGIGFFGPQWTNASPGTYTVTVTDSFGCDTQVLVSVPNATTTTTTQSSSYNYYRAVGCDTGTIYILRSTTNWLIGMSVLTNKFGEDSEMCIDREELEQGYDYSILGMGDTCTCDGPADP